MRLLPLLSLFAPALLIVACSAPSESPEETASRVSEITGTSCAVAREKILSSVSTKRRRAIERGFQWLDDDVPYSQSASHEGYRTDCSGFVSMCWELGKSATTSTFYGGDSNEDLGSWNELIGADAMVKKGHIMMFLAWNDSAKSSACVIEQSSTKNDMQFRVRTIASLKSDGYKPIRATKLAADLGGGGADTGSSPDEDPPTKNPPQPNDEPTETGTDPSTGACTPASVLQVCAEAKLFLGARCGSFDDGCGGIVDCTSLPGFGCAPNEVCRANACVCVPMKAAEACDAANATAGVECGTVDDGCGGKVNCTDVRGFGCKDGATCNAQTNRCESSAAPNENSGTDSDVNLEDAPKGDEGDDKEPPTKPSQKGEGDDAPAGKKGPKTSSGGCSASPVDSGGGHGSIVLFGLALARLTLRRSRARARGRDL